jgi:hypothetical protein
MFTIAEAIGSAGAVLGRIDVAEDFENFFLLIDNHVPEADSSANMVAVDKETGERCNFVAVIPELGSLRHTYEVRPGGELAETEEG